jgi:hypothetical protein
MWRFAAALPFTNRAFFPAVFRRAGARFAVFLRGRFAGARFAVFFLALRFFVVRFFRSNDCTATLCCENP